MRYGFGVDVGGTTVKLGYFRQDGKLLDKWEIPTDVCENGSYILPDIADAVAEYLSRKAIPRDKVLGIGIGVPGPVLADGTVNRCINLGWGVFNIEKTLREMTGFPVKAGNDASVAALGECWQGGGKGCSSMVFVTFGTGVGGGIVSGGKVIPGAHGAAGEIGHMVLNPAEKALCSCGKRGCVEQYCSATGIVELARRYLEKNSAPSSLSSIPELSCKDVFQQAAAGDGPAREILEQVYKYMGIFLANVCAVTDPEAVVIGGGVSKAGQPLPDGIRPYFDEHVFHACKNVAFALAALGNDAGIYGAFKLLLTELGG